MIVASGSKFAGYTIVRLLGSGGMGDVYLVEHPRLPRHDALKILPRALTADIEFRQRFIREADLAATLFHPHIVGMHDRGEYDDQLWISMDYIDGTDAAQLVCDRYPAGMPVDDVLAIVTALAGALDHAHERLLLHRDVKPANVLLSEPDRDGQRRIFLADFGIARPMIDPSGLTATNLTVGTVAYAAPEQLMGSELDGRADQYALAATAYHLLTGAPLFQQSNPVAVISQHLTQVPPPVSDRRPDLARLNLVLAKALAKDPGERFMRCRDFATAFHEQVGDPISEWGTEAGITSASPIPTSKTQLRITTPPAAAGQVNRLRVESTPGGIDPPAFSKKRKQRPKVVLAAALAVILIAGIGLSSWVIHQKDRVTPTTANAPVQPAAVLDGTYRLDYMLGQQTVNGSPNPPPEKEPQTQTAYWAYRQACTSKGCVATGTALDDNHKAAITPNVSAVWHYADSEWLRMPDRQRVQYEHCSVDGDKEVAGGDTEMTTWTMTPQSDGTLRGLRTNTVLTSECGLQGVVRQDPFVAARIGDIPPGVTVADPVSVVDRPTISSSPPTISGPLLDGTYRLDYDFLSATNNKGVPNLATSNRTYWWAFRSSCAASGCVATGAELDDANYQEASGLSTVLRFDNGHWHDVPLTLRIECGTSRGSTTATIDPKDLFTVTASLDLEPQPDGTLEGVATQKMETNECALQGTVFIIPVSATRTGDAPANAILADPDLFNS
ncbi:serine/threonine protein kinase [Mycobacterium sp. OAE908]|uniref:serine/threonine-protein kinase n=1 Tax=Mycobacterium sp. OAE908 TaxID=2817899 RepID=UPI001AEA9D07